jgi:hypothetical protein
MIIYTHQKSKKKKKPNAKQRELQASWEKIVDSYKATKPLVTKRKSDIKTPEPYIRVAKSDIPSMSTPGGAATKPIHGKVYTGTKMLGIGTLHKSNAVPIFSSDDAKDQANMRR